MRMFCAGAGRDAIIGVVNAVGQAKIAAVVDKRDAARCGPCLYRAVGNAAPLVRTFLGFCGFFKMAFACFLRGKVQQFCAQAWGEYIAARAGIVGIAIAAVDMDNDPVGHRHIDGRAARIIAGRAAISDQCIDMHRLIGNRARYALVERVDGPANGLTAKEENRRPAQHFNPLNRQRINRDGMIGRCVGGINVANTIRQDSDPIALITT